LASSKSSTSSQEASQQQNYLLEYISQSASSSFHRLPADTSLLPVSSTSVSLALNAINPAARTGLLFRFSRYFHLLSAFTDSGSQKPAMALAVIRGTNRIPSNVTIRWSAHASTSTAEPTPSIWPQTPDWCGGGA